MQNTEINSTLNIWGSSCLNEQMNPNHISWRNCEINCVDIYLGRKQLTQRDRVMMVTENSSEAVEKELFSSHYVCLDNYNQLISLELNTTYNHFPAYFWRRKQNKKKKTCRLIYDIWGSIFRKRKTTTQWGILKFTWKWGRFILELCLKFERRKSPLYGKNSKPTTLDTDSIKQTNKHTQKKHTFLTYYPNQSPTRRKWKPNYLVKCIA